jgi:hypothetical protein
MQELNQQLDGNQINSYKSIEKYYDKQMLEQMTKEF